MNDDPILVFAGMGFSFFLDVGVGVTYGYKLLSQGYRTILSGIEISMTGLFAVCGLANI
jgi:hypothetical protein